MTQLGSSAIKYVLSFFLIISYISRQVLGDDIFTFDPTSYKIEVPDLAVSSVTTSDNKYIYIASGKDGLNTYNIEDLKEIKKIGNLNQPLSQNPRARRLSFFQKEQFLLVAFESAGLVMYDISNKKVNPILVQQFSSNLYANSVSAYEDTIILATQQDIYLITKVNGIYQVPNAKISIGTFIRNIRVFLINSIPYAFITLGEQGIKVVDLQQGLVIKQYQISKSECFDVSVDKTGNYAFAALTIYGIDLFDISTLNKQPIDLTPQKPLQQIIENSNYYYSLFINGNHMYASSYGRGVQIYFINYDSNNKVINLSLIQEIILIGDTTTIYTDTNETLLFSTKNSLMHINQRTTLQNVDFMPNLQNTHQQIRYSIENQLLNVAWDSVIYQDHFLIVPYGNLYIIDFSDFSSFKSNSQKLDFDGNEEPQNSQTEDMQLENISQVNNISNNIDGLAVDSSNDLLFLGRSQAGLYVYKINKIPSSTNVKEHYTLSFLKRYQASNFDVNDIDLIANNKIITLYCALGTFGIQVINYDIDANTFTPTSIKYQLQDDFQNSRIVRVINVKNNYLFAGARRYGVLVYDLADQQKQTPLYKVRTSGGEDFEFSSTFQYLYVADFLNGFSIVELNFNGNQLVSSPTFLSRVLLDGQALMVQILQGEQYVLVGQIGNRMISLIDIQSKENPKLIQTLNPENEIMQSFVVSHLNGKNQIIMPTTRGLRIYDMKRPFDLFYEIYNVEDNIKKSYQSTLLVGENLIVKLVPLNLQPSQKYSLSSNLYLIQNSNMQPAPNYINFNPILNEVHITLNKENQGVLVFIAKFLFQITEQTFTSAGFKTKAKEILSDAQQRGFLDSNSYPTEIVPSLRLWTSVSASKYTETNIGESDAKYLIEQIFNSNIIYYPVRLNVNTSIQFSYGLKENTPDQKIISSLSKVLKITINNIDVTVGEFINKKYDQIQTEFANDQSTISLIGDPSLVAQALQKLRFHSFLMDGINLNNEFVANSQIEIKIEDSINYSLTIPQSGKYLYHKDVRFINYNEKPAINKDLQTQFDQSGGIMFIEQDFSFTFNLDSFKDEDPLTYTAFIVNNNDYTEIGLQDDKQWIHFDYSTLKFTGFASYSKLGNKVKIVVRAFDGYYSTEDSFEMKIYSIPFNIIFNRFITAVSGLSGLIVVWKIRGMIHMILCKRKIRYSTEIAKVGEKYRKQIPVVIPYIERCSEFINIFLKYINVMKKEELLLPKKTLFCIKRYKKPLEYFIVDKKIPTEVSQIHNNGNTAQEKVRMLDMEKITQYMIEYTNTLKSEDRIVPKKWFKSISHISQPILQGLLNYQFMEQFEKNTYKIFKELKKKATLRRKYKSAHYQYFSKLDWYLEFAHIEINEEDIFNKENEIRLPKVIVNYQKITKIYNQTDNHDKKEFNNKMYEVDQQSFIEEDFAEVGTLNIPNCNDQLLIENIKNYSLGIVKHLGYFSGVFQPARGCSVHVDASTINILKAMKKTSSQGIVRKIKELISMDYDDIELQVNRKLPNWLTCEWQNGSIYIYGTPEKKDVRNYQIRLEDVNQFILMNYKLLIVDGEKQNEQLLQLHPKNKQKQDLSFDDLEGVETLNVMIKRQKQIDIYNQMKKGKTKKAQELEQKSLNERQNSQLSQDKNKNDLLTFKDEVINNSQSKQNNDQHSNKLDQDQVIINMDSGETTKKE